MRFIEVKDIHGEQALIDPLSIQAITQEYKEETKITRVYFSGNMHLNLSEDFKSLKNKLDKVLGFF